VCDMATAGTTVIDIITGIQCCKIIVILNEINETNAEKEGT